MCTVSIVAANGIVRMVCNRDERRSRAAAVPPSLHENGPRSALFPVDPDGGGTWIGVNDAGFAVALLNRNEGDSRSIGRLTSRGQIVRDLLLNAGSIEEAVSRLSEVPRAKFADYRLIVVDRNCVATVRGAGRASIVVRRYSTATPRVFSSSSLGDHLVQGPRRRLFTRLLAEHRDPRIAQRLFHRHHWPSRPEKSVVMRRADARTVSRTQIDLGLRTATLDYEALHEGRPAAERRRAGRRC